MRYRTHLPLLALLALTSLTAATPTAAAQQLRPLSAADKATLDGLLKGFDPNSYLLTVPYVGADGQTRTARHGKALGLASVRQGATVRPGGVGTRAGSVTHNNVFREAAGSVTHNNIFREAAGSVTHNNIFRAAAGSVTHNNIFREAAGSVTHNNIFRQASGTRLSQKQLETKAAQLSTLLDRYQQR